MIVDCAIYEDGERRAGDLEVSEAARAAGDEHTPAFAWLGVHEPTPEELDAVPRELDLHNLPPRVRPPRARRRGGGRGARAPEARGLRRYSVLRAQARSLHRPRGGDPR